MLNTPNEWHNEDDIEEYSDEDFSDDYGDSGNFGEDTDFGTLDDSEYENNEYEDTEESEEYENDNGDNSNGGNKKTILIVVAIVILLIVLVCVGLIVKKAKSTPQIEEPAVEAVIDTETPTAEAGEDGEVSIEIDENASEEEGIAIEEDTSDGLSVDGTSKPATASTTEEPSGLEIEVDEEAPTFANKPNDTENVTIAIGDVGRKNPFAPIGGKASTEVKTTIDNGLDFEVIEPPELEPEDETITKLLETKVTGIMYDARRPSAIVNVGGIDQLVRVGDILSGFEFVAITKNKVVIRSDNNVYRASVGQPLNAEKITNPVEISNLETKFKGATR